MLSPYENVIIGNFIYGLGLVMGRKPRQIDSCVNLLQQTPLDKVLGDVMLQFPGAWRLIEFKRVGANVKKERVKLATYRGATRRDVGLRQASLRAHWFVETGQHIIDEFDNSTFQMNVRPYLKLEEYGGISLEAFAEQVAADAYAGPPNKAELNLYLRLIKLFGCLDGYETSGLLVGVGSNGGLSYLPLENITDLKATSRLLRARLHAREEEFTRHQASRGPFSSAVQEELTQRREVAGEMAHGVEPKQRTLDHGPSH